MKKVYIVVLITKIFLLGINERVQMSIQSHLNTTGPIYIAIKL